MSRKRLLMLLFALILAMQSFAFASEALQAAEEERTWYYMENILIMVPSHDITPVSVPNGSFPVNDGATVMYIDVNYYPGIPNGNYLVHEAEGYMYMYPEYYKMFEVRQGRATWFP